MGIFQIINMRTQLSPVWLFAYPKTVAARPLFMGFFFQWILGVGYHFLLQGIYPNLGINCLLHCGPTLAGGFFIAKSPGKPHLTEMSTKKINKMHYRKISEKWQRETYLEKQSEGRWGLKVTECKRNNYHQDVLFLILKSNARHMEMK